MKDKTIWQLAFGVVVVALVLSATGKLPGMTASQGTVAAPVVTADNAVGVVVSCYQEEIGPKYGLLDSDITILDASGVAVYPTTNAATGTKTLDTNAGFKKGGKYTVVCEKNTNTGAYRSEKSVTFDKDVNAVEVPMKKVGNPSVTFTAASVTMTTDNMKYLELDLSTAATKTWLYKPIIAIKDYNASDQVIATGEITDIKVEKATAVNCDIKAMTGYNFCFQVDQEWVSDMNSISDQKIWLTSSSVEPAGYLTVSIFDGVPGAAAGTASINEANAYDTDASNTVITVA